MTSAKFSAFWTPSPPCHCPIHATYQYYCHVLTNPPPSPSVRTSFKSGFLIGSRRSRGGVSNGWRIWLKLGRLTRGNLKTYQEPIFGHFFASGVIYSVFCVKIGEKLKNGFFTVTHFHLGLAKSWYVFGIKIWGQATRTSNFSSIAPKALILQLSEGLRRLQP